MAWPCPVSVYHIRDRLPPGDSLSVPYDEEDAVSCIEHPYDAFLSREDQQRPVIRRIHTPLTNIEFLSLLRHTGTAARLTGAGCG